MNVNVNMVVYDFVQQTSLSQLSVLLLAMHVIVLMILKSQSSPKSFIYTLERYISYFPGHPFAHLSNGMKSTLENVSQACCMATIQTKVIMSDSLGGGAVSIDKASLPLFSRSHCLSSS